MARVRRRTACSCSQMCTARSSEPAGAHLRSAAGRQGGEARSGSVLASGFGNDPAAPGLLRGKLKGDRLAWFHVQVDVLEDWDALYVLEVHVVENDLAADIGELYRALRVDGAGHGRHGHGPAR